MLLIKRLWFKLLLKKTYCIGGIADMEGQCGWSLCHPFLTHNCPCITSTTIPVSILVLLLRLLPPFPTLFYVYDDAKSFTWFTVCIFFLALKTNHSMFVAASCSVVCTACSCKFDPAQAEPKRVVPALQTKPKPETWLQKALAPVGWLSVDSTDPLKHIETT